MRIFVTGSKGMLGRTLMKSLSDYEVIGTDLPELDLTDVGAVNRIVEAINPDVVVHSAAYTAVDACETALDTAWSVNALASANIASACYRNSARIITISTDYVFDGSLDRPYFEGDITGPKTVYGKTKLAGEDAVRTHCPDHSILRIAWLYGPEGPSFVHSMLKLGALDGDSLKVVADQIGNPTSTDAVAQVVRAILERPIPGVIHATCEGEATWYEFAREIFRLASLTRKLEPCSSDVYIRPAPRPANSRLDNTVMRLSNLPAMPHWKEALRNFLKEHPNG